MFKDGFRRRERPKIEICTSFAFEIVQIDDIAQANIYSKRDRKLE